MAAVEHFFAEERVANWMLQSGEALRDYMRVSDAAPVRPSDIVGNTMECPRENRVAYRPWGVILDW